MSLLDKGINGNGRKRINKRSWRTLAQTMMTSMSGIKSMFWLSFEPKTKRKNRDEAPLQLKLNFSFCFEHLKKWEVAQGARAACGSKALALIPSNQKQNKQKADNSIRFSCSIKKENIKYNYLNRYIVTKLWIT